MGSVRYNTAAGYSQPRPAPTITPAYVQLWTPRSVLPTLLTLTEGHFWAFQCHYWQRRTRPCTALEGGCEACAAGMATRLTAWVSAVIRQSRQRVLLQLTAGALAGCPQLVYADGDLDRRLVNVRRRHDGKQSPVDVELAALRDVSIPVVPPSTAKVLAAVWGMTESSLNVLRTRAFPPAFDSAEEIVDNAGQ